MKILGYLMGVFIVILLLLFNCEGTTTILKLLKHKQNLDALSNLNKTTKIIESDLLSYKDSLISVLIPNDFDEENISISDSGIKYSTKMSISLDNGVFSRLTKVVFNEEANTWSPEMFLINVISNEVQSNGGEKLVYNYTLLPNSIGKLEGAYYEAEGRFKKSKVSFTGFFKVINYKEAVVYFQYGIGESENTMLNYAFLVDNINFK